MPLKEADPLFEIMRHSTTPAAAAAIERLVCEGTDRELNRVNVFDFAAANDLSEEVAIAAFVHAAKLGLFDMSWNLLCPGCGGVLGANETLKTVHKEDYPCGLCAVSYTPTLDEMVEVSFTVSPRIRVIAAHTPDHLSYWDYMRQVYWSSGIEIPDDFMTGVVDKISIEALELAPHEKAIVSLQLPAQFVIIFDPVTHASHFLDVKGEPTRERQEITVVLNKTHAPTATTEMRPGPLRLAIDNQTNERALPGVYLAGDTLHDMLTKRRRYLTASRLLTNQTFRDVYRTDALEVDQKLKITSMTFLFTDLKGSTAMYERVGDLVAYDLVRAHFAVLQEAVSAESGAIVKTIGDAVMATFPSPERGMAAAIRMRSAMRALNAESGNEDLIVKIGVHEGPCLAVMLNDRLDYFGQTVNIAARVQGLAEDQTIFATSPIVSNSAAARVISEAGLAAVMQSRAIRGVQDDFTVYEIP